MTKAYSDSRITSTSDPNANALTVQAAVVTNALGSVVATYKDGWLTADRSYDPYGETRAEWNDVGRFGWVGGLGYRETRREWLTHYVRARHYGYPMGMWTSVDPLWPSEPAFGYAGGRTMIWVDPSGRRSLRAILNPCNSSFVPCDEPCSNLLKKGVKPSAILAKCLKDAGNNQNKIKVCLKKHGGKVSKSLCDYVGCIAGSELPLGRPGIDPECGIEDSHACYSRYVSALCRCAHKPALQIAAHATCLAKADRDFKLCIAGLNPYGDDRWIQPIRYFP